MSSNIKIQKVCEFCGMEFTARTLITRYCSHKCNSRHYKHLAIEEKNRGHTASQLVFEDPSSTLRNAIQEYFEINEAATIMRIEAYAVQTDCS